MSDKLANILNQSLRRRPSDDKVKVTAAKIKIPNNVDNFKAPVSNSDITKAMTTSGKILDARLARTNGILSKVIVPIARLLSDFGEKKSHATEKRRVMLRSTICQIQIPV